MTDYDRHLAGLPSGSLASILWWCLATALMFLPGMWGKLVDATAVQHTRASWWAWSNYYACKTSLGATLRVRRVKQAHAESIHAGLVHTMVNPMDQSGVAEMRARHDLRVRAAMADLYVYLRRNCPALVDDSWRVYLVTGNTPY